MKIDILLVEDESDWISIITGYIDMCERLRLVGCTKEEDQMLSLLQKHNVDIVLLDLCLKDGIEGVTYAEKIQQVSDAKIIVLTSVRPVQSELFIKGISGYLYKNQMNELCATIEDVYEGNYPYEEFFRDYRKYRVMSELSVLTHSERAVLVQLLQAATISQISARNQVSESTVKNQINSIYRKLGIYQRGKRQREELKERYLDVLGYL